MRSPSQGANLAPIEFRPPAFQPLIPIGIAVELDHHAGMLAFRAAVQQLEVYQPHCVIAWREQVAGMDEMGGIVPRNAGCSTAEKLPHELHLT